MKERELKERLRSDEDLAIERGKKVNLKEKAK